MPTKRKTVAPHGRRHQGTLERVAITYSSALRNRLR